MNPGNKEVFINCPFDTDYRSIFNSICFTTLDCGFSPRCALEEQDCGEQRMEKLYRVIEECQYGVHDISMTDLDSQTGLPRFNMPFELGLYQGCRRYGPEEQRSKRILIFDRDRFRYHAFLSDISGQDIVSHKNDAEEAIMQLRDWLRVAAGVPIPGTQVVLDHYAAFCQDFSGLSEQAGFGTKPLGYTDYIWLAAEWLRQYREPKPLSPAVE